LPGDRKAKHRREKPALRGHFPHVSAKPPIGRVGGGGRSHNRTGLHSKFPANREKNREFSIFRPSTAILPSDIRVNSQAFSRIPYAADQGNISEEQGILVQKQGI
jgi:hypothetical protein